MCLAQGPQRSDAGEVRTRGPSVSSQALYYWATALPKMSCSPPVRPAFHFVRYAVAILLEQVIVYILLALRPRPFELSRYF